MSMTEPTTIPETAEELSSKLRDADAAWTAENHELSAALYYAAWQSGRLNGASASRAHHRIALTAYGQGNLDEAFRHARLSDEPGSDDLRAAIDAARPDLAVDPNRVPDSLEQVSAYWQHATYANERGDTATAEALFTAIEQSPALDPGPRADVQVNLAELVLAQHRYDEARTLAEHAIANGPADIAARARAVLHVTGSAVIDANPYETDGATTLLEGITAFEQGDTVTAKARLEAVLVAEDVTESDRGRASFYLGSMAYQAGDFDVARDQLHRAQSEADDPERGWAAEQLASRWQE